jgi:hypothetical protein
VREVFEAEDVSGVRYLAPLRRRTDAALETIVQVLPTTTMGGGLVAVVQETVTCSPHDNETNRIRIPSQPRSALDDSYCGRIKYHVPRPRRIVHYWRSAFEGMPDIVLSAEWFGTGAAAEQHIIVSNKIARLVLRHKWRGLELEPIELV